jgi:hypothetical protein
METGVALLWWVLLWVFVVLTVIVMVIGPGEFGWYRRVRGGHWEQWRHAWYPRQWWLRMPRCTSGTPADYLGRGHRLRCEDD